MGNHRDAPSYSIPLEARAPLMAQLALAWDGQWFLKVYDKFGWDIASEINARVRTSWSKMEMRAALRALGKREADDLADALAIWQAYMEVFVFASDAFVGEQIIEGDTIHVTATKCPSLEGATLSRGQKTAAKKYIAIGWKLKGDVLMAMGKMEESIECFEKARDFADQMGYPPLMWRARFSLGQIFNQQGKCETAKESFEKAKSIIERMASNVSDTEVSSICSKRIRWKPIFVEDRWPSIP